MMRCFSGQPVRRPRRPCQDIYNMVVFAHSADVDVNECMCKLRGFKDLVRRLGDQVRCVDEVQDIKVPLALELASVTDTASAISKESKRGRKMH